MATLQQKEQRIQAHVTVWHRLRLDDGQEGDPTFESIIFDGVDVWTLIIQTAIHGREQVIVHSDGETWEEVHEVRGIFEEAR